MPKRACTPTESDPYALRRFTTQQSVFHPQALAELQQGAKATCWMWWIMPTPPHIVNGIERGSANNITYAIRSEQEARAYLSFQTDGVDLRRNYIEIVLALRDQLAKDTMPFGRDVAKMRSSLAFFAKTALDLSDTELSSLILDVIGALNAYDKLHA